MKERDIEDIATKYPSIIEEGLTLRGRQIKWGKIESRKSCRIQTTPREKYGMDDDRKWDELQETLIDKMKKMVKVLYHIFSDRRKMHNGNNKLYHYWNCYWKHNWMVNF